MSDIDAELKAVIESGGIEMEPDPVRMGAVRDRMLQISRTPAPRFRRPRTIVTAVAVVATLCIVGVAAMETGRRILRRIYTPVGRTTTLGIETGSDAKGNRKAMTVSFSDGRTISDQEAQRIKKRFAEVPRIKQAGGGHLTGLIEMPGHTTYVIEYRLPDGSRESIGEGSLSDLQAANMRIDEIKQLRDAGQGQLIARSDFPMGLGKFAIRFTLSDGKIAVLQTYYPPGTRQEREAIFAETRRLKQERQFKVRGASRDSRGSVHGLLQYKLADGRMVGISEEVPREVILSDGKVAVVGETDQTAGIATGGFASESKAKKAQERRLECSRIADAGGGRLVEIMDHPGRTGRALYRIGYTLSDGTNETETTNMPTEKQRANFRLDDILALRDAGQGQIVGHGRDSKYPRLTVRYTLSDGRTVDVDTDFPPCTRQQREATFAEANELQKSLRFSVLDPVRAKDGMVLGVLRYDLSDGRTVEIPGWVPPEVISADGKYVVVPGSSEKVEIKDFPAEP